MAKVIFITVANDKHGYGHLQRTNRIASSICNRHEVVLICNDGARPFGLYSEMITLLSFDLSNPKEMLDGLLLGEKDILWFDLPDTLSSIIAEFADLKQKIITMNMFFDTKDACFQDVFICPGFDRTRIERDLIHDVVCLTGVDFVIVPDEFFFEEDDQKVLGSVLITMGGADPKGITQRVINSLVDLKRNDLTFKIILPAAQKKEKFSFPKELKKNIQLLNFGEVDFAKAIKEATYAIISGGVTRYECIAAKTYFVAISIHDAQFQINEHTTKHGLGYNLGVIDDIETWMITDHIENMLLIPKVPDMSESDLALKRNGGVRVFNKVMELIKEDESE